MTKKKKNFEETKIKGKNLNMIKGIYDKPMAAITLKSGLRQGCPSSPFLFNTVPEILLRTVK